MKNPRKFKNFIVVATLLFILAVSAPLLALASEGLSLDPDTQFYVPKRNQGAIEQIADLTSSGEYADADLIRAMIEMPQAVWFTGSEPHKV